MGSDHYCLRWNNHQSNLLGVFSQLLRDESLVDVTLACSEGHSIRAHKVVLSACSSYFQTLFIDHPARHPIVILKDVRFAELSTLIEFMYHGEVNVEHCQLSELLRTAESLKVKGLTDMGTTNLPAVGLQQQQQQQHQQQQTTQANKVQIQAASQHGSNTYNTNSSTSTSTSSGTTTTCCKTEPPPESMAEPEQTEPTELLNKPTKPPPSILSSTSYRDKEEARVSNPMITGGTTCLTTTMTTTMTTTTTTTTTSSTAASTASSLSVTPISLVSSERRSATNLDHPMGQPHQFHMPPMENAPTEISNNKNSPNRLPASPQAGSSIESETLRPDSDIDEDLDESDGDSVDYKPSDMRLLPSEPSLNLNRHDGNISSVNSVRHTDMVLGGNAVGIAGILGRLPSPSVLGAGEPIAGPSSIMPPVQQVPLSLKKEVDWGGGSADEKSNIDSPSDYPRHSLDPSATDIERCFIATSPATSSRQSSSRSSTPAFTPHQIITQQPQINTIAAAVVGYHQQHHHNLTSSLLEAGLVHPALFNAAAAAAAVAAAGVSAATAAGNDGDMYRCSACMAAFPSIWLLEQHTALQHIGNLGAASTSSSSIDKPFVCEQCGQSYRYRSAYVKHREQNHRARLPADKLFSCDFCGMQFRYLKSFKKHRLNHALERLHGKANSETRLEMICGGSGIPSGSKETTTSRGDSAVIENSSDQVSSSNETLTITDDQPTTIPSTSHARNFESPPNQDEEPEDNPSTSGQREHIIVDSDPMQLANTSDSEPEVEQDDTIDSAAKEQQTAASLTRMSSPSVVALPSTSAASSTLLPGLATAVASGSMATVEAVEAFRSAHQASIINFLRADAAERQRERRFACPFCGKCVRSKENLKLHVRKHTGERPFVCLFCGRAFGGKSDLTRHLRIHTGERPYHCDMCGKCFARADYLSKHLTTHINTPR